MLVHTGTYYTRIYIYTRRRICGGGPAWKFVSCLSCITLQRLPVEACSVALPSCYCNLTSCVVCLSCLCLCCVESTRDTLGTHWQQHSKHGWMDGEHAALCRLWPDSYHSVPTGTLYAVYIHVLHVLGCSTSIWPAFCPKVPKVEKKKLLVKFFNFRFFRQVS